MMRSRSCAILQRSEQRLTAGVLQSNDKLAFFLFVLGRVGGGGDFGFRSGRRVLPSLSTTTTSAFFSFKTFCAKSVCNVAISAD